MSHAEEAREIAKKIDAIAAAYAPGVYVPEAEVEVYSDERDYSFVEIVLPGRRIGVTCAPDAFDCGWHYVSSKEYGGDFEAGEMSSLDLDALVKRAIDAREAPL